MRVCLLIVRTVDRLYLGSEHRIGGLQYAAELHLVHQGIENPDRLAVVGVFLKLGKDGKTLSPESSVLENLVKPGGSKDSGV